MVSDSTQGAGYGTSNANLRGLGPNSTLVLLNGRRLANFASPGDDAGVDLNSIPSGAIQRVEVLKDGASAIYGTDAIGGVINFILRKDFSGLEAQAFTDVTEAGGGHEGPRLPGAVIGDQKQRRGHADRERRADTDCHRRRRSDHAAILHADQGEQGNWWTPRDPKGRYC